MSAAFCRNFRCQRQAVLLFCKNSGLQIVIHVFSPALMLRRSCPIPQSPVRGTNCMQACWKETEGSWHGLPGVVGSAKVVENCVLERERHVSPARVASWQSVTLHYKASNTWVFPGGGLCIELLGSVVRWVAVESSLWAKVGPRDFR